MPNTENTTPPQTAGAPGSAFLKRRMDNAIAAFHRIPDECELDTVECMRRIKRMVRAKLTYFESEELTDQ